MAVIKAKVKQKRNMLDLAVYMTKSDTLKEKDRIEIEIKKTKRINGLGMFKNIPSFKEEEELHKEFW